MYNDELDVTRHDDQTTFLLAVHHLELAYELLGRLEFTEFEETKEAFNNCGSIPDHVQDLVEVIMKGKEFWRWYEEWKDKAAHTIAEYGIGDPMLPSVWQSHESALRQRLELEGWPEDEINDSIGDLGNMVNERRGLPVKNTRARRSEPGVE